MTAESEQPKKMRRFINEFRYASGDCGRELIEANLPDPTLLDGCPTVTMPTRQMVSFRNRYLLLIHFAALFCKCEPEELTDLHLMAPFIQAMNPEVPDDTH